MFPSTSAYLTVLSTAPVTQETPLVMIFFATYSPQVRNSAGSFLTFILGFWHF